MENDCNGKQLANSNWQLEQDQANRKGRKGPKEN
jgi:hypothetical protein